MNRHLAFLARLTSRRRRCAVRAPSVPEVLRRRPSVRLVLAGPVNTRLAVAVHLHRAGPRVERVVVTRAATPPERIAPSTTVLRRTPGEARHLTVRRDLLVRSTGRVAPPGHVRRPPRTVTRAPTEVGSGPTTAAAPVRLPQQSVASRATTPVPSVDRVVRRGSASTARSEPAGATVPPGGHDRPASWPSVGGQPHPVLPMQPADVQRLTDQVVQVIDQRILAHRERTGRGWS
jgi:hypothetical protein